MDKVTEFMLFAAAGDTSVDQALFNTPGTYSWVVPPGITSVSLVAVQGGQGGASAGGAGGALAYINNIPVTPGETLTVIVGAGGNGALFVEGSTTVAGSVGSHSYVRRASTTLVATDWGPSTFSNGAVFSGGRGGPSTQYSGGGGGGAAGYSGPGGEGSGYSGGTSPATAGSGGAGGGGGRNLGFYQDSTIAFGMPGGRGGGVGLQGQGANGAPGGTYNSSNPSESGRPGSPGSLAGDGIEVGGGGGGGYQFINPQNGNRSPASGGAGLSGGVRIMWPGDLRQFPSTRTLDE